MHFNHELADHPGRRTLQFGLEQFKRTRIHRGHGSRGMVVDASAGLLVLRCRALQQGRKGIGERVAAQGLADMSVHAGLMCRCYLFRHDGSRQRENWYLAKGARHGTHGAGCCKTIHMRHM